MNQNMKEVDQIDVLGLHVSCFALGELLTFRCFELRCIFLGLMVKSLAPGIICTCKGYKDRLNMREKLLKCPKLHLL